MPTAARKSRIETIIDAKIAAMRSNRNIPEKTRRTVIGLMLVCGLVSVSALSIDIIDAIYVNVYIKIALVFFYIILHKK